MVMALQFKIVTHIRAEGFEITVIPYHADFIYEYNGLGWKGHTAYIIYIKEVCPWDIHSGIDGASLSNIAVSSLCKKCCLAASLLAEHHDKLIWVPVFEKQDETGYQKKQKNSHHLHQCFHDVTPLHI